LGDPNDLAEAVVFLASNGGNFVTGATLDVNGGLHMG
jgi:NAD(P)-dependent dehydrogenase (short-subunit alcohol dehydrogenase family)